MPIFRNKVLAGNQFTGLTDQDGLFAPNTGSSSIQIRINSLRFHTEADTRVDIRSVDPEDPGNVTLFLTESGIKDLYMEGITLPTTNIQAWPLIVTTTGMTTDGWLVLDFDAVLTAG